MALKAVAGDPGLLFMKETLKIVELAVQLHVINRIVGGAGRSERSFCTDGHHLGPKNVAVMRSRGVAANQGVLKYNFVWRCSRDQGEWPL